MQIPKRFNLFGRTINVGYDEKLKFKENCVGECRYRTNEITLLPHTDQWPRDKRDVEHTFLHEVTHCILGAMNEDDLNNNEKFVDVFAGLLHQALTTQEFE